MAFFTDQLNRKIEVVYPPKKIVSLVPSQTELLHYLGLENKVVGITKFCVHPTDWFKTKELVGGTKNVKVEKIKSLSPDLIIANKEENIKEQIEELAEFFPIWISDVNNLTEAYEMIAGVGAVTGRQEEANRLVNEIKVSFDKYKVASAGTKKVAYLIWKDPYMTVGGDTFINSMLQQTPFLNVFADQSRYPQVSIDDLNASGCEVIFLSSEPYPFALKHVDELKTLLPGVDVVLVDGEPFSWYGSRLLTAPPYFAALQQALVD